jgi:muramoyltetrapeptide carboxypeptidase LdcA involved in peptidoglycan recycling
VEERVCVCEGEEREGRKEKRERRDGKRWFSVYELVRVCVEGECVGGCLTLMLESAGGSGGSDMFHLYVMYCLSCTSSTENS